MTRAEANEVRRFALTERLHELCAMLGKSVDETSKLIAADRMKNENKLPSHLTWLEKQVRNAEAAVDAQEALPL
jgi:LEA14-like dessication related protein